MPSVSETRSKIYEFAGLEQGWRFGSGEAVDSRTVYFALVLLEQAEALGFSRLNAFVYESGELMLSVYSHGAVLDISVRPDGSFLLEHELASGEDLPEEELSFFEVVGKLWQFSTENPPTSELSTRVTTISRRSASQVQHSKYHRMRASQSSSGIVGLSKTGANAPILRSTIGSKQATPRYSGQFPTKGSRTPVR